MTKNTLGNILDCAPKLTTTRIKEILETTDTGTTYKEMFGEHDGICSFFGDGYQNLMILALLRKIDELERKIDAKPDGQTKDSLTNVDSRF